MYLLSVILIAIATNLDNLGIGLTYGVRKIRVPLRSNLAIALMSGGAILLSAYAGHFLKYVLPGNYGNILGGLIVSGIGLYTILKYYYNLKNLKKQNALSEHLSVEGLKSILEDPCKADKDYSGDISIKEALLLGIALAVNCLAAGIGAGMTGVIIGALTISVIITSIISISIGVHLGKKYASKKLGDRATIVSGLVLLLVGVLEIFI